ncbi:hypothetical protein [Cohnella boryungensis]|uniref:Uncharacterized protein n=1 Tax=Cohnella boryungensis TaxID=768479 RepID=A0ABV8SFT7_9BACL
MTEAGNQEMNEGAKKIKKQRGRENIQPKQRRHVVREAAHEYVIQNVVPFNEIERWLEEYPRWKQRIETIKSQLSHIYRGLQHV